jgi:hypothetical protein
MSKISAVAIKIAISIKVGTFTKDYKCCLCGYRCMFEQVEDPGKDSICKKLWSLSKPYLLLVIQNY